jgi:hypothetical protein
MKKDINTPLAITLIVLFAVLLSEIIYFCGVKIITTKSEVVVAQNKINTGQKTDETTNWQTYQNEEYGFELKFPPTWKGYRLESEEGTVKNYDSQQYKYKSINFTYPYDGKKGKISFIIGIFETKEWKLAQGWEFLENNNKYVFGFYPSNAAVPDGLEDRYDEMNMIKKTFNLISSNQNWETYKNDKYNIKFKYPKNWGNIKQDDADLTWNINPESLESHFSHFPGEKNTGVSENNSVKFITKKAYNDYTTKSKSNLDSGKRYEVLENIYNTKDVSKFDINEFNAGSAAYSLFREKPLVSKYVESYNGEYRGTAYYGKGRYHDVMSVSHPYRVVLINNRGNIVDMYFKLDNAYFDDLTNARNKEIESDIKRNNNKVNEENIKTIDIAWEKKYKERFKNLITNNAQFKKTINDIDSIVASIKT